VKLSARVSRRDLHLEPLEPRILLDVAPPEGLFPGEKTPVGLCPHCVAAGDFSSDGIPDLAVANSGGICRWATAHDGGRHPCPRLAQGPLSEDDGSARRPERGRNAADGIAADTIDRALWNGERFRALAEPKDSLANLDREFRLV